MAVLGPLAVGLCTLLPHGGLEVIEILMGSGFVYTWGLRDCNFLSVVRSQLPNLSKKEIILSLAEAATLDQAIWNGAIWVSVTNQWIEDSLHTYSPHQFF